MKRSRYLILLCLLSLSVLSVLLLAACGETAAVPAQPEDTASAGPEEAADSQKESETTYPAPDLPDHDYTGQDFTILCRDNGMWMDVFQEEASSDTIRDAIYRRNLLLEEEYGISVKGIGCPDDSVVERLYTSVASGEEVYDMACLNLNQSYLAASQELLSDFSEDVPVVDLNNPWWDHETNEALSICDRQYYVIGDASVTSINSTWMMLFNQSVLTSLGYGDDYLYDLVREGKWTLDAFYQIVKSFPADLNQDNNMTVEDRYAMSMNGASMFGFLINAGVTITEKDENDELVFHDLDDRTLDLLNQVFRVLNPRVTYNHDNGNQNPNRDDHSVHTYDVPFRENRALFFSESFGSIELFRDMESDYGIIPHPKYKEEDDYRTFINSYGGCAFSVPITAPDPVKTGILLEKMNYLSTDSVIPVYFERILEGKYARDAASYEMIHEQILPKRTYDHGMANDIGQFNYLLYNLIYENSNAFSSAYARSRRAMVQAVEAVNETFR